MAAVARRLGPYTPMALYRHVLNKDGLFDLMLDHVTGEIPLPSEPGGDWHADLRQVALDSRHMVKRHLWYAQLVPTRPPLGPRMMRRTEFLLQVLIRQGATVGDAMTYPALLDRHIFGSAQQEAVELAMRRRHGLHTPEQLTQAITAAREPAAGGATTSGADRVDDVPDGGGHERTVRAEPRLPDRRHRDPTARP